MDSIRTHVNRRRNIITLSNLVLLSSFFGYFFPSFLFAAPPLLEAVMKQDHEREIRRILITTRTFCTRVYFNLSSFQYSLVASAQPALLGMVINSSLSCMQFFSDDGVSVPKMVV